MRGEHLARCRRKQGAIQPCISCLATRAPSIIAFEPLPEAADTYERLFARARTNPPPAGSALESRGNG